LWPARTTFSIGGDVSKFRHFDCIVVVVCLVLLCVEGLVEDQFFVALGDVEVCKPARVSKAAPVPSLLVSPAPYLSELVVVRNHEIYRMGVSKPYLVLLDEAEDLLVGDGVVICDDEKLLLHRDELRYIFSKQRKRRVGDYNIRFFQQLDAFVAAEIPITFEGVNQSRQGRERGCPSCRHCIRGRSLFRNRSY